MKKTVVLAAVAGIASAASAQNATLSIVPSQAVVDSTMTSSITLSVYADADFATHVTGAAFTMDATGGAGVVGGMTAGAYASTDWQALGADDFGDAGDGNHNGLILGQIVFLPFIQPDAASALGNGPVFLGSFTVDIIADSEGVVSWAAGAIPMTEFMVELIDVNANPGGNPPGESFKILNPSIQGATVEVIPTPSSIALLGLGGLVAGRRRR